ncbi:MAG: hypothetical protein WCQ91_02890 [Planctomycetota bacterium]
MAKFDGMRIESVEACGKRRFLMGHLARKRNTESARAPIKSASGTGVVAEPLCPNNVRIGLKTSFFSLLELL